MVAQRKRAIQAQRRAVDVKYGVSYTRYSTEEQGSTADQLAINDELADEDGIVLVARFEDEGLSRSLSERQGLVAMFDYIQSHPNVRYIIVNELERLTAGVGQRAEVVRLCKKHDVTIVTEDIGTIDPWDDEKMQEADERAVRSQGEVLKIRRRTKRSLRARARNKTSVIFRPPYGVRMVPLVLDDGTVLPSGASMIDASGKRINSGKIELHPDEHPHLLRIFQWAAEGVALGDIARRLNAEGVRTKMGVNGWRGSTVRGIVNNAFYKGELVWGRNEVRRHENGKRFLVERDADDPGRVDRESPLGAIVDPRAWDAAQVHREAARTHRSERTRLPRQVLDGLVYCDRCGFKMYGRNQAGSASRKAGHVYWSYVCHSQQRTQGVDDGRCKQHTMSLAAILAGLAAFQDTDGGSVTVRSGQSGYNERAGRARAQARIDEAKAEWSRAQDFALKGLLDADKLAEAKARCEAEVAEGERVLAELGSPVKAVEVQPLATLVDAKGFLALIELLRDDEIPLATKRQALDKFGVEKIYVDKPLLRLDLRD